MSTTDSLIDKIWEAHRNSAYGYVRTVDLVEIIRQHQAEQPEVYIEISSEPSTESEEIMKGIVVDYDKDGCIVGIDIDKAAMGDASTRKDEDNAANQAEDRKGCGAPKVTSPANFKDTLIQTLTHEAFNATLSGNPSSCENTAYRLGIKRAISIISAAQQREIPDNAQLLRDVQALSCHILCYTPDKNTQTPEEVQNTLDSLAAIAEKYDPFKIGNKMTATPAQEYCDFSRVELATVIDSMNHFGNGLTSSVKGELEYSCKMAARLLEKLRSPTREMVNQSEAGIPASGWQPIETAPRDYKWIIIGCFDNDGRPEIVRASRWEHTFWQSWGKSWPPTPWMPCPFLTEIEGQKP